MPEFSAQTPIGRRRPATPLAIALGVAFACAVALAACGSSGTPEGTAAGSASSTDTIAVSDASEASTAESVLEPITATATGETTSAETTSTTKATAVATDPDAVAVTFDAPKGDPRPIRETMQPIAAPTNRLSMEISGLTYRGVVCGFTFHGEAPPSPLTIRLSGDSGAGPFDSGALKVSWTELDSDAVTSAAGQDGRWNFSSEAHVDRSGNGWVISLGGVTPADGDEAAAIPRRASCVLEASTPVFTPANGPVGYWASFAGV
jgi:hypothetical protein